MDALVRKSGHEDTKAVERIETLVALGPVLALERLGDDGCCCRWFARAAEAGSIVAQVALAPDGPREELLALDRRGEPRARVLRIPDSDYFAWERALERFGARPPRAPRWGWPLVPAPVARGVIPRWRASVVRLQHEPVLGLTATAMERLSASTASTLCALTQRCEIAFVASA